MLKYKVHYLELFKNDNTELFYCLTNRYGNPYVSESGKIPVFKSLTTNQGPYSSFLDAQGFFKNYTKINKIPFKILPLEIKDVDKKIKMDNFNRLDKDIYIGIPELHTNPIFKELNSLFYKYERMNNVAKKNIQNVIYEKINNIEYFYYLHSSLRKTYHFECTIIEGNPSFAKDDIMVQLDFQIEGYQVQDNKILGEKGIVDNLRLKRQYAYPNGISLPSHINVFEFDFDTYLTREETRELFINVGDCCCIVDD